LPDKNVLISAFFLYLVISAAPGSAAVVLTGQSQAQDNGAKPAPGSLVLPDAGGDQDGQQEKSKKCMTVCGRWGEECTYINRGAGGLTKKCRRACQQFTEECF